MGFILDKNRRKILDSPDDLLIIGGPGSGKTTISLFKAFRFLSQPEINRGQQVLFLSFSRNARARILESAEKFEEFDDLRKHLSIQTFHGFFLEIVKCHGYLLGTKEKINVVPPHDEAIQKFGRKDDDLNWLEEREQNFLMKGQLVFDLFAPKALEILSKSARILELYAKRFPLIIVDEAQDTDSLQWSIVKCFAKRSQLTILADLRQQIYDYRENVNSERLDEIKKFLNPVEFDFSSENHRSPEMEILKFAQDIYNRSVEQRKYKGVDCFKYAPQQNYPALGIMRGLREIRKLSEANGGMLPKSIAILARTNAGVKSVSRFLNNYNVPHKYQFDEVATNISSRLVACLMEPILDSRQHLLFCLFIVKEYFSTKGNAREVDKYTKWIESIKDEKKVTGTMVPALVAIISTIEDMDFTGNPAKDWRYIQSVLYSSTNKGLAKIAKHSENLVAFNRGKKIMQGLTERWDLDGRYSNARGALQAALVETQISNITPKQSGINLMNMHQSKGKEFDAVIIYENPFSCPFEVKDDTHDYLKIRKLLFVAITRARNHVVLVSQHNSYPPIMRGVLAT